MLKVAGGRQLVMAQPYTDKEMSDIYQIPPLITTWLNDKDNLSRIVGQGLTARRYASYGNGKDFAAAKHKLKLPYVVKASSSSAGDGVLICLTVQDADTAASALGELDATILVEEYIDTAKNYGIHFGIPHDGKPIDFLGINEQLTTPEGAFVGGIITSRTFPPELASIKTELVEKILPKVRQRGWYGVGCFDVLVDKSGKAYFIDGNFRMTGMSAYHFLVANSAIKTPLIGFSGEFKGTQEQFEYLMEPLAAKLNTKQVMQLIALSRHGDTWNFNAALFFSNKTELQSRISALLASGIKSDALEQMQSQFAA